MLINTTAPLVQQLNERKIHSIVITTHHKPDGDAMGSTLGLWGFLREFVEDVVVCTPTDYAENLFWLPGNETVLDFEKDPELVANKVANADVIFCLDFNRLSRINHLGDLVRVARAEKVMMDHHLEPEEFAQYTFWNHEASSTCELVYQWIESHFGSDHVSSSIATCLYTGLMTDTGNFQHNNTKPGTLRLAADLMEHGADHLVIHANIYDVFSLDRSRLFGYSLYKKLEIIPECKTALIYLDRDELRKFNVQTGDTEGLVNFGLGLKDIVFSVLIIDRTERVKMSFRSKGNFPANELATKYFEGGGHRNAAGGQSTDTLEATVAKFKKVVWEYQNQLLAVQ
ncbi:MAG: DHH family phosphoesterase [Bacteroidota bacterium]|jgi:phosphoesterase RecJ-like protein